jgi:Predicted aminoglycoside phosphotransferase
MLLIDNLINKRRAEKIVKDFYGNGAKLLSMKKLPGGKSNAVYRLISDKDPNGVVVRSAHLNKKSLLVHEKSALPSEAEATKLLLENGIDVPHFLKYRKRGEVIDREYAVYKFIKSDVPGREDEIDYKSLNEVIEKLHAIKGNYFGFIGRTRYGSWYEFIADFSGELLGLAEKYRFFKDKKYTAELGEEIKKSEDIFNEINTPYYVHNDIGRKNFLFGKKGNAFHFLALIDLENSLFGDADFEFGRAKLTDGQCYDRVMLKERENLAPNRIKRLRIYSLINYLISMHIMRVKYRLPRYFKRLRERYIECFENKDNYYF